MKSKILLVGFACLSLVAVAQEQSSSAREAKAARDVASGQASGKQASTHEVKSPRDAATGQASGRRTNQKAGETANDGAASREASTGKATGRQGVRVSVGDVDGDGKADVAATENSSDATKPDSGAKTIPVSIKTPRDSATGQATGKRQHSPMTVTKQSDK